VRPLLKKVGLHARDQNSFRPVCNLRFMFKLLERVVQARLQAFLDSNWLMPKTQSVYGKYHSSEIAFTRLYNDPLWPGCSGRAVAYRKSPPVRHSTMHCSSPAWKRRSCTRLSGRRRQSVDCGRGAELECGSCRGT